MPQFAPENNTNGDGTAADTPLSAAVDTVMNHFAASSTIAPVNQVMSMTTLTYLAAVDPADPPPPDQIQSDILNLTARAVKFENTKATSAADKLPRLKTLNHWQIAQIMLRLHNIVRIAPSKKSTDPEYDALAMYIPTGPGSGTYTLSDNDIRVAARKYDLRMSTSLYQEVVAVLREDSPRVHRCQHPDLVAVNNGIFFYGQVDQTITINGKTFDFKAKSLHPFDPALIFTMKVDIDWDPHAASPVITHPRDGDWEIEKWMKTLSDDEGVPELLWEIIGAIIRPNVRWNKTAWFYSEKGNNGKGTICTLLRNVCGPRAHTSIAISEFGADFALEPLLRATSIITDENDVGLYIDKVGNLKAVVTGDVIRINRKYRTPIAFEWRGFVVQCLNEFPKIKDRSESFYRRQLFIPFRKSFTGVEKRYIKDEYLQRTDVLQYVLKRVLLMDYYTLSEPTATKHVLEDYKVYNDPVREFWEEFAGGFAWDLLPWKFLYDLFAAWYPRTHPAGNPMSYKAFVRDMRALLEATGEWDVGDGSKGSDKHRPAQMMDAVELLIHEYDLKNWTDPYYSGYSPHKRSQPVLATAYYGAKRLASTSASPGPDASNAAAA